MENPRKLDTSKKSLDLREGWVHIEKDDVEDIMNRNDKGRFWRFNDDKKWITTLNNGKVSNYKTSDIEILLPEESKESKKFSNIKQKTETEVLMDLFLTPDCKVRNTAEAYEKARYSDKTKFWFISKGKDKSVIILDFSRGKKPKTSRYPLDKYNIKMKAVEV